MRTNPKSYDFYVHKHTGGLVVPMECTLHDPVLWTRVATVSVSKSTKTLPGALVVRQGAAPVFGLSIDDPVCGGIVKSFTETRVETHERRLSIVDVLRDPAVGAVLVLPEPTPAPPPLGALDAIEDAAIPATNAFKSAVRGAVDSEAPFRLFAVKARGEHTCASVDLTTRVGRGKLANVDFVALVVNGALTVCDFDGGEVVDVALVEGDIYHTFGEEPHKGFFWQSSEDEDCWERPVRPLLEMRLAEVSIKAIRIEADDASVKRLRTDVGSAVATIVHHLWEYRKEKPRAEAVARENALVEAEGGKVCQRVVPKGVHATRELFSMRDLVVWVFDGQATNIRPFTKLAIDRVVDVATSVVSACAAMHARDATLDPLQVLRRVVGPRSAKSFSESRPCDDKTVIFLQDLWHSEIFAVVFWLVDTVIDDADVETGRMDNVVTRSMHVEKALGDNDELAPFV